MSRIIQSGSEKIILGAPVISNIYDITGTNTQQDFTLSTAVDLAKTILMFSGSKHNGLQYSSIPRFTLLNSTTIRANRGSSSSATSSISGSLITFSDGVLASAPQYGSITIPNGSSSATGVISSVNTARAEVSYLGHSTTTNQRDTFPDVTLTGATQVTATRIGTTGDTIVNFCVAEFSANDFVAKQTFDIPAHAANTTYLKTSGSGNSVNLANSLIFYKGAKSNTNGKSKKLMPVNNNEIISEYQTGTVFTDDATAKIGAIQLVGGIKTSFANVPISASGTTTPTIAQVKNYLRTGLGYLSSGGISGWVFDDYSDSTAAKMASNTTLELQSTVGNSITVAYPLHEFA